MIARHEGRNQVPVRLERQAGRRDHPAPQQVDAAADEAAHAVKRQGALASIAQRGVDAGVNVRRAVDQRPVEIEYHRTTCLDCQEIFDARLYSCALRVILADAECNVKPEFATRQEI